jgi:hypothetical protein
MIALLQFDAVVAGVNAAVRADKVAYIAAHATVGVENDRTGGRAAEGAGGTDAETIGQATLIAGQNAIKADFREVDFFDNRAYIRPASLTARFDAQAARKWAVSLADRKGII